MHEDIKTFALEGEINDSNLVETRERLIDFVESMMREHGSVPVLDMDPQFTLDYNLDREIYKFKLTVYGVHVGKEEAWDIAGIMNGKQILKHTPNPK